MAVGVGRRGNNAVNRKNSGAGNGSCARAINTRTGAMLGIARTGSRTRRPATTAATFGIADAATIYFIGTAVARTFNKTRAGTPRNKARVRILGNGYTFFRIVIGNANRITFNRIITMKSDSAKAIVQTTINMPCASNRYGHRGRMAKCKK
jgi:hypothetical protein